MENVVLERIQLCIIKAALDTLENDSPFNSELGVIIFVQFWESGIYVYVELVSKTSKVKGFPINAVTIILSIVEFQSLSILANRNRTELQKIMHGGGRRLSS